MSFPQRHTESFQQLLSRALLAIDTGNLFDPADPPGTGLLHDGRESFLHGKSLPIPMPAKPSPAAGG